MMIRAGWPWLRHHTAAAMVFSVATGLRTAFPVALTKKQCQRLPNPFIVNFKKHNVAVTCTLNWPIMRNSSEPVKMMEFLNTSQEKLWQAIPGSLKTFPWKKLGTFALNKFLVLGKESLKWSLLALYALSFISDIVYSISQNKELVIPFGLFAGYVIACYIDDISRELFNHSEVVGHLTPQSVAICFFALVKIVAVFIFRGKDVLLHLANGGLMQVLWNLRRL